MTTLRAEWSNSSKVSQVLNGKPGFISRFIHLSTHFQSISYTLLGPARAFILEGLQGRYRGTDRSISMLEGQAAMPRPQKGRSPDLVGDLTIGVQLQCVPGASQEHGTVFREDLQSSHTLCSDQTIDTLCMQLLLSLLQMFSLPKMPFPCILVGLDPRHVLVWLRCHLCHFAALNLFRQCGLHPLPSSATKHVPMLGHTLVLH